MRVARGLLQLALSLEVFCARNHTQNIFTVWFNQADEHPGLSTQASLVSEWPQQELWNRVLPIPAFASVRLWRVPWLCVPRRSGLFPTTAGLPFRGNCGKGTGRLLALKRSLTISSLGSEEVWNSNSWEGKKGGKKSRPAFLSKLCKLVLMVCIY